jgi:multidrug transporter EmrE-like cation transporter
MTSSRFLPWLYVALTIGLGVYGQAVLKWQIAKAGPLPPGVGAQIQYLANVLSDPWVLSGVAGAFLAMLFWIAALAVIELSVAYPFTSASFVLILLISHLLFGEPITTAKVSGMVLIIAGLVVGSQ